LKKAISWIWNKQRAAVYALSFFLLAVLLKNIAISALAPWHWYKDPLIGFFKLLQTIGLLSLAVALVSRLKWIGNALVMLLMTANLLVGVEAVYCLLYEWKHRPGNEANLAREKEAKKQKADARRPPIQRPVITDPRPVASSLQSLQLFTAADSQKVAGEPEFRMQEAPWDQRQVADENLGFANKPNARVEDRTWTYGIPNPLAHYTIDSLGRRMTGLNNPPGPDKKYALFFGCSVAFGLHVDDDQTLPAFFEGIDTTYRAYNYAVAGYGSHHMLALLESRNLRPEIPEKEGLAVYTYFIGHTARAIGDMDSYLSWNATSPYYTFEGEGLRRKGSFKTGRWLTSWFYERVKASYIGRYYDLRFPGKLQPRHYRLTAKIIQQAAREYERQFGNDRFYVLILPGYDEDEMLPYLQKLGLKVIDCTYLVNSYWEDKYHFRADGHPRPLFYRLLAEKIHAVLNDRK
jgi:hypothetical protein